MQSFAVLLLLVFTVSAMAQSQPYTIHGKVVSFEESLALEGVSVRIKGTTSITGTQADGTFSIEVSNEKQVLIVELTGYETQEIKIGSEKDIDIALKMKNSVAQHIPGTILRGSVYPFKDSHASINRAQ